MKSDVRCDHQLTFFDVPVDFCAFVTVKTVSKPLSGCMGWVTASRPIYGWTTMYFLTQQKAVLLNSTSSFRFCDQNGRSPLTCSLSDHTVTTGHYWADALSSFYQIRVQHASFGNPTKFYSKILNSSWEIVFSKKGRNFWITLYL